MGIPQQTMKAMRLSEYLKLELTELPVPLPGSDEILVRVAACGICGSDVHGFDGSTGRRIPPIVMGHEAAGTIAGVGSAVTKFSEGDRVTFDSTVYCGNCEYCRRSEINLCDNRRVLGVSCGEYRRDGAFAEYVLVPQQIVHRLPESLSFAEAAMLEAVSVALHGVSLSGVSAGNKALVVGAGMIGLLTLQSLLAARCSRVLVVDVDSFRLKLALDLGASAVALASAPDLASQVVQFTDGRGFDVALEAVGITDTIRLAIDSVRKGGTVVLVGNVTPEISLPLQKVVSRQIRLQGSCASSGEYPRAIELVSRGKIRVKSLISAIAPLEDGPQWFQRLHSREPNLMKVVLTP